MIIGTLAGVGIFLWFYFSAGKINKDPLQWGIAGFVVYLMIAGLWTYFVNPGIKDSAMHTRNTGMMYISRYAYIFIATGCALLFNWWMTGKADSNE